MTITKNRHRQPDLYKDVEKIKAAILSTTQDAKNLTGETLSHSLENVKNKSSEAKDIVSEYTAKKPFKSLGMTFLFGLIIGYLFHK